MRAALQHPEFILESLSYHSLLPSSDKYQIKIENRELTCRCTLLDTFDQSIRKAGLLLFTHDHLITLVDKKNRQLSQPVSNEITFVSKLESGPVKEALSFVSALRCLQSAGQVNLCRTQLKLMDDEQKTVAKADAIELGSAQQDKKAFCLITPQPVRGYDKAFNTLVKLLDKRALVGMASDLYQQLIPAYQEYDSKPLIKITKKERSKHAAQAIITTYLLIARANEPGIIQDLDTEYLHDYRIAIRKIHSVLSLFSGVFDEQQTQALQAKCSDFLDITGRVRDLDVYLLERHNIFESLPKKQHKGLEALYTYFKAERQQQFSELKSALQSEQYHQAFSDLEHHFTPPQNIISGPTADQKAFGYAKSLIWNRYCKVCKIASKIDATTPDETLHRLRRQCKKLRYLIEFFTPLFPQNSINKITRSMKQLQDTLGRFNDYSVQQEFLSALLAHKSTDPERRELNTSVKALIKVLSRHQQQEREKIKTYFTSFDSKQSRLEFRQLFYNEDQA